MKILYVFKGCEAKEFIIEFLNKGWGLWGLKNFFKKLRETRTTAVDEAATLKAYRIALVILFCSICTQTGYYKKGIYHFFRNFSQLQ